MKPCGRDWACPATCPTASPQWTHAGRRRHTDRACAAGGGPASAVGKSWTAGGTAPKNGPEMSRPQK